MKDNGSPDRELQALELLSDVLDMSAPERVSFIDRACGTDERLRMRLLELLSADEAPLGLSAAIDDESLRLTQTEAGLPRARRLGLKPGDTVGPFLIEELLGRGGMGEVHAAVDTRLDRKVALKIMSHGTRFQVAARARFLREARVLSSLDHPAICRIHELVQSEGVDLLVLELVEGRTLRTLIGEGNLTPEQGLDVARQVLDVLVVAHDNGIVHRDLKPENVMLTPDGDAKVLDFGLSRALEGAADAHSEDETTEDDSEAAPGLTRVGQVMGTPGYMSPEQARGERSGTASDVYAFGLLLQELVTGQTPFDPKGDLLKAAVEGITRPLPAGLDADLAELIGRLTALKPSDRPRAHEAAERLDWILSKPKRRRKRVIVGSIIAFLSVLSVLLAVQTVRFSQEADRANKEASTARESLVFLTELFSAADPEGEAGRELTAQELLERGAARIGEDLAEQPEVQATLLHHVGRIHRRMSRLSDARDLLSRAVEIRRQEQPGTAELADSLKELGAALDLMGRYEEAESVLLESIALNERLHGEDSMQAAWYLTTYGNLLANMGRHDEAEEQLVKSLAIRERDLGPEHPALASALSGLGANYRDQGRLNEAEEVMLRAYELDLANYGDRPNANLASDLVHLGHIYRDQGRFEESLEFYERGLEMDRIVVGEDSVYVGQDIGNIAEVLIEMGQHDQAVVKADEAIAVLERVSSGDAIELAHCRVTRSLALFELGRWSEALSELTRASPVLNRGQADDAWSWRARALLGKVHSRLGNRELGCSFLREALNVLPGMQWKPGADELSELEAELKRVRDSCPS